MKYNEIGADKVRKRTASYENIYHSTNFLATEGFGINLCFLKRGCHVLQDGEFFSAWGFSGRPLIHNLLEAVIETMTAEARG